MQDPAHPETIDVFIGVDVGKGQRHVVALDRGGKRLLDRALPNIEAQLKALIGALKTYETLLFVVDQPASIGAPPIAVARAEGIAVAYLPGLAMHRIADLHAGEAKTDARDAAIIAEAARSMPHALRTIDEATMAKLNVHLAMDNCDTHGTSSGKNWFARHPLLHAHFTSTSSS